MRYEIYVDGKQHLTDAFSVQQVAECLYVDNLFSRHMADRLEDAMSDGTDSISLMYTVLDSLVTGSSQPVYEYSKHYYSDMIAVVDEMLDEAVDGIVMFESWDGKEVVVKMMEEESE